MTAEEIRKLQDHEAKTTMVDYSNSRTFWLSEIAAQLAEWNERSVRAEKKAMEIADRSMAMMERSEKSLDELDENKNKRERSLV